MLTLLPKTLSMASTWIGQDHHFLASSIRSSDGLDTCFHTKVLIEEIYMELFEAVTPSHIGQICQLKHMPIRLE